MVRFTFFQICTTEILKVIMLLSAWVFIIVYYLSMKKVNIIILKYSDQYVAEEQIAEKR